MRVIVDAQLPPALATWLCERDHDAVAVRETGLRDATDEQIWRRVLADCAVLITKDADFNRYVVSPVSAATAVVWVRTGNASNDVLLAAFE